MGNWPYTNLNELNLDWILDVIKDFQSKYSNIQEALDQAVADINETEADALDAMVSEKNRLLAELSGTLNNALAAINTARTNAETAIDTDRNLALTAIATQQTNAQNAIETDRAAAVSSIATTRNAAEEDIAQASATATTNIERLTNALPADYADLIGKMEILGAMIQQNATQQAVWQLGAYDIDGTFHASYINRVSCTAILGCSGLTLRIKNNASGYEIKAIDRYTGYDSAAEKYTGFSGLVNINAQEYEYTVPSGTYCISIEMGKTDNTTASAAAVDTALTWVNPISSVFDGYQNLWTYGEHAFTKSKTLNGLSIPAGTYVFRAKVKTWNPTTMVDAGSYGGRAAFYSVVGGTETQLSNPVMLRYCEQYSVVITLSAACNRVKLFAAPSTSLSDGLSCEWTDLELIPGTLNLKSGIEENPIFEMKNVVLSPAMSNTWPYKIIRRDYAHKTLLVRCKAKYQFTQEPENEYTAPTVNFYPTTADKGTAKYEVGDRDTWKYCEWRLPPWPNFQSGDYINTFTMYFNIPNYCRVTIESLTVEYDEGTPSRYQGEGLKVDTHSHFMYFPNESKAAIDAAIKCGSTSIIVIPKCSSDGVWFAYHDDTFDLATTVLRDANGDVIASSQYDGQAFRNIPWSYLKTLTINEANTYGAFPGEHLMKIEDFFTICNKCGVDPIFSVHPQPNSTEIASLYTLAKRCGVLKRLTLKMSNLSAFTDMVAVFGSDIKGWGIDADRSNQTLTAVNNLIAAMNESGIDGSKCERFIELWINEATDSQVAAILAAGLEASLASYSHTTPTGATESFTGYADYKYWNRQGVTRFTASHNPSIGLNW